MLIRFRKRYAIYNRGEVAGFPEAEALKLIADGTAYDPTVMVVSEEATESAPDVAVTAEDDTAQKLIDELQAKLAESVAEVGQLKDDLGKANGDLTAAQKLIDELQANALAGLREGHLDAAWLEGLGRDQLVSIASTFGIEVDEKATKADIATAIAAEPVYFDPKEADSGESDAGAAGS